MDDYCHPCRRHLNGALTCPGCGTPVEAVRAYGEWIAAQEAAVDEEPRRRAAVPVRARAGRRSHRSAGPGRRGRVLLATAGLALVAGGVGLGVAQLGEEPSDGDTRAQAAPDTPTAATKEAGTAPPSATSERSTPAASRASRTPSSPASTPPRPERTRTSSAPVDAAETTHRSRPAPTTSAPRASATSRPTSSAPRTPSATPTGQPDPSATCDRFLWWCT
ncbi:hypothetical protein ABZY90_23160 [Streptomyces sp. NPDC006422]|uniref:SCO2400 family protein n=1 Tax=unclassified Streptomyces TaxID=2593676 RepID=UPI0033A02B02